jgi:hypothetical protein
MFRTLVQAVDAALMADTGQPAPAAAAPAQPAAASAPKPLTLGAPDRSQGEIPVKWEINHFVKGQTDTYVPFTINVDRASVAGGAAVYVRIVNAEQAEAFASMMAKPAPAQGNKNAVPSRPTFAWDSINFVDVPEDGRISRAVQLKPGQYAMFVAVKEKTPSQCRRGRREARSQGQRSQSAATGSGARRQSRHPSSRSDRARLHGQRSEHQQRHHRSDGRTGYGASRRSGIESVRLRADEDRPVARREILEEGRTERHLLDLWSAGGVDRQAGRDDRFQLLSEADGGRREVLQQDGAAAAQCADAAARVQRCGGPSASWKSRGAVDQFPAGDYRLEIKVTDKPSGKTVTQNVNFTVLPV